MSVDVGLGYVPYATRSTVQLVVLLVRNAPSPSAILSQRLQAIQRRKQGGGATQDAAMGGGASGRPAGQPAAGDPASLSFQVRNIRCLACFCETNKTRIAHRDATTVDCETYSMKGVAVGMRRHERAVSAMNGTLVNQRLRFCTMCTLCAPVYIRVYASCRWCRFCVAFRSGRTQPGSLNQIDYRPSKIRCFHCLDTSIFYRRTDPARDTLL